MSFKTRPLFFMCLSAIIVISFLHFTGLYNPSEKILHALPSEKKALSISAVIAQKNDDKYLIKNIKIANSADNSTEYTALPGRAMLSLIIDSAGAKSGKNNKKLPELSPGDELTVTGFFVPFSHATNPGEFDAADYYCSLGIYGRLTAEDYHLTDHKINPLSELSLKLRGFWERRLYKVFPKEEASVMCALLLGDKSGLDPELKGLYQRNAIAHILSISSMHVAIIGYGIFKLLRRLSAPLPAACILSSVILSFYGFMTGMSVSASRAIGSFVIVMLALAIGRTPDRPTTLSLVALLILLDNPSNISSCSFLLSFGAALGIFALSPTLKSILIPSHNTPTIYESPAEKKSFSSHLVSIKNAALDSLISSTSITLTTLPVQLYFYYEIPLFSVFLNLLIIPLLSLLMLSGMIAMLIPGTGFFGTAAYWILKYYEFICRGFDKLPLKMWTPGRPAAVLIGIYVLLWLLVVFYPYYKSKIKHRSVLYLTYISSLAAMLVCFSLPKLKPETIIFLDVGQGDCILCYTSARAVYLFDAGSSSRNSVGKYVLAPALKYYGLSVVDAAFISHTDSDHYNGITELIASKNELGISIDKLFLPDFTGSDKEDGAIAIYNTLSAANGSLNIIRKISAGDFWQSGNTKFTCLHPKKNYETADINTASACFLIEFESSDSLLLCGDLSGDGEKILTEILKQYPPVTMLKVAHHGSSHSTGDEFLSSVFNTADADNFTPPRISFISVGRNNIYGHPGDDALNRLKNAGSIIYRTDKNGAISVEMGAAKIIINTFN